MRVATPPRKPARAGTACHTTPPMITFARRGRRLDTAAAERMAYLSDCGRYRVEHVWPIGYAEFWRAAVLVDGQWLLVDRKRHRRRGPAEKACLTHRGRRWPQFIDTGRRL
jgi:hypothetical protein